MKKSFSLKGIKEADEFYESIFLKNNRRKRSKKHQPTSLRWHALDQAIFQHRHDPLAATATPANPFHLNAAKKAATPNGQPLHNEDIISMPDKWEYPWYAAWDFAFHCIPWHMLDAEFAKNQLLLFLRNGICTPNGQIPAYEWNFGDVNPPVHAWGCMESLPKWRKSKRVGETSFF